VKTAVVFGAQEEPMPSFDQTPDMPEEFGFKISWFAVKASDPASVLEALEFGGATPANWASGLAAAYGRSQDSEAWVFASPPISGWVLVVGSSLPYPSNETHHDFGRRFDELFSRLMNRFEDVQYFGSHRVVDFAAWARAMNGKPLRIFAWSGSDGAVLANIGEQTPEEAKLGFTDLSGLSPSHAAEKIFAIAGQQQAEQETLVGSGLSRRDARAKVLQKGRDAFPGETDVVDLAELWSINPLEVQDQGNPSALGLAVRLPRDLSQ
jgi:hypothetical protein